MLANLDVSTKNTPWRGRSGVRACKFGIISRYFNPFPALPALEKLVDTSGRAVVVLTQAPRRERFVDRVVRVEDGHIQAIASFFTLNSVRRIS